MIIGKVVGNIVSTRKNEKLIGFKLMLIKKLKEDEITEDCIVAVDQVGAGIGEKVLVVTGSAARCALGDDRLPVDACVVGIID